MRKIPLMISGALSLWLALPALTTAQEQDRAQEAIDLSQWDTEALYQGWRAEELMDTEVRGTAGEELGEVEDILFGPEGEVVAVIVEGGGFWDIGDTHFRVPWEDVEIAPGMEYVTVPVTEETLDQYSVFGEGWDAQETPRLWRASELIDDYASLTDVMAYGVVDDIIISREGEITAVIVAPDVAYGRTGPRAYPYYGYDYGFDPAANLYSLPYTEAETLDREAFAYDRMDKDLFD